MINALSASSAGDPRFRLEKFLSEFVGQFISATVNSANLFA